MYRTCFISACYPAILIKVASDIHAILIKVASYIHAILIKLASYIHAILIELASYIHPVIHRGAHPFTLSLYLSFVAITGR